jgi:hypothetical protein
MVKIFELVNDVLVPTEHCNSLETLRKIKKEYKDYMQVYLYLFYMTCPNPDLNPFFDTKDTDKEELIISQLGDIQFTAEDPLVIEGLELLSTLYETPTLRAYKGIKGALDNLADYMSSLSITDGKDGNITQLINAAAKFDQIRQSFKGAYKDLMEEQKSLVRGGQQISYDQR